MHSENDIIRFVSQHLERKGYKVSQALSTLERGTDIIAKHATSTERCLVEAKGETSSDPNSRRYGKPFTAAQVRSHVGVAIIKCFQLKQENPQANVYIALPGNQAHSTLIDSILDSLLRAQIGLLLVSANGRVSEYSPIRGIDGYSRIETDDPTIAKMLYMVANKFGVSDIIEEHHPNASRYVAQADTKQLQAMLSLLFRLEDAK